MNLFISFSGGLTSAYMTKWLIDNKRKQYEKIVVLFSNTGQEDERTLEFVNRCDKEWNFNVVWLEAVVQHEVRVGTKYKVTDFKNAARNGEPFEEVIIKYGIPNHAYPHCTRELKLAPMNVYIKDFLKWEKGTFETAIGIRADEMDRVNSRMNELNLIYPLCEDHKMSKRMINDWWQKQGFTLGLFEHEGNCMWCHKKTKRKLLTLAKNRSDVFEFPMRMEAKYGLNGHNIDGTKRKFFRKHQSTIELLNESKAPFDEFDPLNIKYKDFDFEMDVANGCSESCEVY